MVFNRLKKVVKSFVSQAAQKITSKVAYRELTEEDIEPLLEDLVIGLVESDVAYETAEAIAEELKKRLIGKKIGRFTDPKKYVLDAFREAVISILERGRTDIDLVREAKRRQLLKLVFFGVNGVGKTTTIAKVAYYFKKHGITPVIVAADTYRAGAQEQLKRHADRLGLPIITAKYGSDPAAVVYDAIKYAKARNYRVLLVDTAGRMHADIDLMEELRKLVRVAEPDYKLLVVDALTGNDAVEQAKAFDEGVGIDLLVLTKVDADVKGGTAISLIHATGKPIIFIGTGQNYEDLEKFDPRVFAERIFEGLEA